MFTGIIEEKGVIKDKGNDFLVIGAKCVLTDLKIGDSIAVNGACLTVVDLYPDSFTVEVMPETLKLTNLGRLNFGSWVNLERAMKLGDRLGGHLLSGHIDGLALLTERRKEGNAWLMRFEIARSISKYIIKKGSIAVDGISLTIADISDGDFTVSIIPHTFEVTTLGDKEIGYEANIEVDLIAKYIERLIGSRIERNIDQDFLREHGFV